MTEQKNNPFADRITAAAKEGYMGTPRSFSNTRVPSSRPGVRTYDAHTVRASAKQIKLVRELLDERDLTVETRPKYRARLDDLVTEPALHRDLSVVQASALIEYLFGLPTLPARDAAELDAVLAGHYAIVNDGTVVFLQVDRPTEGAWAGKVFVKLQHGDDYTNLGRKAGETMLARIMEMGPALCSRMYGRHIGKCGVCHRTLTNEDSRAAGIGPVCAEKTGW